MGWKHNCLLGALLAFTSIGFALQPDSLPGKIAGRIKLSDDARYVHSLQFSPCGSFLVFVERTTQLIGDTVRSDEKLYVVTLKDYTQKLLPIKFDLGSERCVAFSPSGQYLAVAEEPRKLTVLSVPDMRKVFSIALSEVQKLVRCGDLMPDQDFTCIAFSVDGKHLCVATEEIRTKSEQAFSAGVLPSHVYVFSMKKWELRSHFIANGLRIVSLVMPDEATIIAAQGDGLHIYDIGGQEVEGKGSRGHYYDYELMDLALNSAGDCFAACYLIGRICLYNMASIRKRDHRAYVLRYAGAEYKRVFFSKDGRWLFVAGSEYVPATQQEVEYGTLHVYNVSKRQLHARYFFPESELREVALSPDGKLLATYTCLPSREILVWQLPATYHCASH
jgi:WD40 repeat protein